jgi:hypothetical protein
MSDNDDHVILYEEAVRRHREREAEKRRDVIHEVKISDAMVHLLEGEAAQVDEGPSPVVLRRIVEREFSEDEPGRSGRQPDERPDDEGARDERRGGARLEEARDHRLDDLSE